MVRQRQLPLVSHQRCWRCSILPLEGVGGGGGRRVVCNQAGKKGPKNFVLRPDFMQGAVMRESGVKARDDDDLKKLQHVQNYVHGDGVTVCYETLPWR